jgi:hypothetical protein
MHGPQKALRAQAYDVLLFLVLLLLILFQILLFILEPIRKTPLYGK